MVLLLPPPLKKDLQTTSELMLKSITKELLSRQLTLLKMFIESIRDSLELKSETSRELFKLKKDFGTNLQKFGKHTKMLSDLKNRTGNIKRLPQLEHGNSTNQKKLLPNGELLTKRILLLERKWILLVLNS